MKRISLILFFVYLLTILNQLHSQSLYAPGSVKPSQNTRVGIGTDLPTSTLDIHTSSGNSASGLVLSQGSDGGNTHSGRLFFENTGEPTNSFAILKTANKLSFRANAIAGSGSGTEYMALTNGGNLELSGDLTLDDKKFIIERGTSVTSELLVAGHGQGAGLMVNAKYSGSGNPQSSATYTVNSGTYNTGAGYLDFDGNARMWSFFVSDGTSVIGNSASFNAIANFQYNQYINLSPTGNSTDFYIDPTGKIGIGTSTPNEKLVVDGTGKFEEVKVEVVGADYVFEEDYDLSSLAEINQFIKANKHLPEVPSAQKMEQNGLKLGEMNILLLKKIEELTLHLINQQEQINQQAELIKMLMTEK